jgi:signal transduction histidine kinase
VRVWLRIFILAAAGSALASALTGLLAARSGYRAQVDAEVRGLWRAADTAVAVLTNSFLASDSFSPLDYVSGQIPDPAGPGTGVEIFSTHLQPLYSMGLTDITPPGADDSPELDSAAAGRPSWVLRRSGAAAILSLAVPEQIVTETIVVRISTRLTAVDNYRASQAMLLGLCAMASASLLGGAALLGSRVIARGLEELAARAAAIGAGDYGGRVHVRGDDEVSRVGREFNRMAVAVAESMEALRREKADRQAFIDDLTHELHTPVTAIVGYADHLRRHAWNEVLFLQGLSRIHDQGLRILRISEGLRRLLLSRTNPPLFVEEDVVEILTFACEEARLRNSGCTFVVNAAAGARLSMDRELMLAAVGNLLDNAAHASAPGGTVTLAWVVDERGRRIVVRDRGGCRGPVAPGLGLGKAICREIADYHGASLEYEPTAGGGMVASLCFPN